MSARYGSRAADDVLDELYKARQRFGAFVSAHEGYAVMLEEMDELWVEVKDNKRIESYRRAAMRKEAIQVAAMAIAFIMECCDGDTIESGELRMSSN